ncbi:hypothetical protein EON82_06470 [bacterium]|nr:MAG: hypothetical protein EON82_06470 [bacterium]
MIVSHDSAWCWFADPRAILHHGWIVAGGVTSKGDVVANVFDPTTGDRQTVVLAEGFERDDHDNPSFLPLRDGRLAAFYTKHIGDEIFIQTTLTGDPRHWAPPRAIHPNDPAFKGPEGSRDFYTYPNPQRLEDGRILLFYRGMNWKPTFTISEDDGQTWSTGQIVVRGSESDPNNRPYVKVWGDGQQRIHLAFTDGHPQNETTNSIYYIRYEGDRFQTADGTTLELPIGPGQADQVYDGKEGRAWIWDVGADTDGHPIVVYARIPDPERHEYRYARWNGTHWLDHKIVEAGRWFPHTPEGEREREPYYSGGIALDKGEPGKIVLSRQVEGRFEIERWTTPDGGASWQAETITQNSGHDNVRPIVVGGNPIWMQISRYRHYTDYETRLVTKG